MAERKGRFTLPTLPTLPTPRLRRRPISHTAEEAPEVSMEPEGPTPAQHADESVIDSAIYEAGQRTANPTSIAEAAEMLHERPAAMAWIGLFQPPPSQLTSVAETFGLHELALEDAIVAHQRPKLERYGPTLFLVLRAARYLDDIEEVEFGEIHLFVGANFVITVRHSLAPDLVGVRRRMESDPEFLSRGPEAVLYAILDRVVDGYAPVVAGLQKDIDEIEVEVYRGDPKVSRRIYELSREVIDFQRSTRPLLTVLAGLEAGFEKYNTDEELQRYLRDVADHATTVVERADGFRQILSDILTLNATLVNQAQNEEIKRLTEASFAQNEEVKRISAWAAIIFAPTLIGTIYGMNFVSMPELQWAFGYPFALLLMVIVSVGLFLVFKARDWL
jgi:magnesium transporter